MESTLGKKIIGYMQTGARGWECVAAKCPKKYIGLEVEVIYLDIVWAVDVVWVCQVIKHVPLGIWKML